MARGVAFDLLQMAKRVGPQCEAAEYEDLSGEKSLTLDRVMVDDRRSHRVTPTMRLYLPRVEARLRGITA